MPAKLAEGLYRGSLRGGLRFALRASRISRQNPNRAVPLAELGSNPFAARLNELGVNALNLSRPHSTLEIFKGTYLTALLGKCNRFAVSYDIEQRFQAEGLGPVLETVPEGLLNRLLAIQLKMSESRHPLLIETRTGLPATTTVAKVFEKLDILDHTIEVFRSVEKFRDSRKLHSTGKLEARLRENLYPNFVGKDGLSPSLPQILKLGDIAKNALSDRATSKVFYLAVLLHDIGKFVQQAGHPEFSYQIINGHRELKKCLREYLDPNQMEMLLSLVRYHSTYSDVSICKEADIRLPYQVVLACRTPALANDLLYILSLCDTDAFLPGKSRLTNERIEALARLHDQIRRSIEDKDEPKDLEGRSRTILLPWGMARFNEWVTSEADIKNKTLKDATSLAGIELASRLRYSEDRNDFFLALGSLKHVGLIFDLRKEIDDPALRTRLLIWLVRAAKRTGAEKFEFKIFRQNGRWTGPQVELLISLLRDDQFMTKLDQNLVLNSTPKGIVEIVFPE